MAYSISFEDIILTDAAEMSAETEIVRIIDQYDMTRYEACDLLVKILAAIIAEDVISERTPWAPHLDEYVYVTRQLDAATAALKVPGLAEHTAAAQEKIIEASR